MSKFHQAAKTGNLKMAKWALRKGQPIDTKDASGKTPLHITCEKGHLEMAGLLLNNGASAEVEDQFGYTPLHYVCRGRNVEMAALLIAHKADTNAKEKNGDTALHFACWNNKMDVAALLVTHGCDLGAANSEKKVFLDYLKEGKGTMDSFIKAVDKIIGLPSSKAQNTEELSLEGFKSTYLLKIESFLKETYLEQEQVLDWNHIRLFAIHSRIEESKRDPLIDSLVSKKFPWVFARICKSFEQEDANPTESSSSVNWTGLPKEIWYMVFSYFTPQEIVTMGASSMEALGDDTPGG